MIKAAVRHWVEEENVLLGEQRKHILNFETSEPQGILLIIKRPQWETIHHSEDGLTQIITGTIKEPGEDINKNTIGRWTEEENGPWDYPSGFGTNEAQDILLIIQHSPWNPTLYPEDDLAQMMTGTIKERGQKFVKGVEFILQHLWMTEKKVKRILGQISHLHGVDTDDVRRDISKLEEAIQIFLKYTLDCSQGDKKKQNLSEPWWNTIQGLNWAIYDLRVISNTTEPQDINGTLIGRKREILDPRTYTRKILHGAEKTIKATRQDAQTIINRHIEYTTESLEGEGENKIHHNKTEIRNLFKSYFYDLY